MANETWFKRAAFAGFILLFVLAAGLAALLPGTVDEAAGVPAVRLADGRLLRVEAVTVGKSHVYRTGPEWLGKLQGAVPRSLRDHLGSEVRTLRHTTSDEQVMPWISLTLAPKSSPDWKNLHVVSDSGEAYNIGNRSFPGSLPDRRFMLPGLSVMPRRDAFFTITGLVDRLPFALRIPNPLHGRPVAEWTPAPVPATNHVGGFDIELAEASLNRTAMSEHFAMRFKAFENGKFLDDWFNFSWRLTDATGNEGYQLSTNEPAWRASLKLSRKFAARWATNEYREFVLPELPTEGELRELNIDADLAGTRVERAWIGGAGEYEIENGVFTQMSPPSSGSGDQMSSTSGGASDFKISFSRRNLWILIQQSGRSPDHTLAAFLIDADGEEIPVQRRGGGGTGYFQSERFEIRLPKDALRLPLKLRIAGDHYLRTEFTFTPADLPRIDHRPGKK